MSTPESSTPEPSTPWELSDAAIDVIKSECDSQSKTVLEIGSGRGTQRLIDAGLTVYSIEHDPHWVNRQTAATLIAPIVNRWYDHTQVANFLTQVFTKGKVAAVIIDGPPGVIGRWGVMHHWRALNAARLIIVDDVHRADDEALCRTLETLTGRMSATHWEDGKAFAALMRPLPCVAHAYQL